VSDARLDRLSINQITVKSWNLEQTVNGCAAAGIHRVGLWLDRVAETGVPRTRQLLADNDMQVSSVCRAGFFTGETATARRKAQQENFESIELTAAIGADVLYLVCGGVPPESRDLAGARAAVLDGIAELAPRAHAAGVRLAVEPLHPLFCGERSVVVTLRQALDIAAEFPAEDVGVAVDSFNVWWDPGILETIGAAGERVISYQVCDWLVPLPHPVYGRGVPGDGVIDFPPITAAVSAAGYDGPIEVEIFNEQVWATDPVQVLELVKQRFVRVFESGTAGS
jgi:sugar phosphate isomerase/epimerase